MKAVLLVAALWLSLATMNVQAFELRPLTLTSLAQLQQQFVGKRHALIFWSLSCLPCHEELDQLASLPKHEQLAISLISTDGQQQAAAAQAFLAERGLQQMDNWVFADAIPERLRAAIDANWYGELPRSYAVDAKGQRFAHSGKADISQLASWLTGPAGAVRTPPAVP